MPHKRRPTAKNGVEAATRAFAALRAARAAGTPPPAWALSATVRVALPSHASAIVLLPLSRVTHLPSCRTATNANTAPWPALSLCPSCDPTGPRHGAVCGGVVCAFVHADALGATVFDPHEAAAAARGAYERFAPGLRVPLVLPGHATAVVPSERLLRTRAFVGVRRAVGACEHFVARGFCDRGAECTFAHPVALPQRPKSPDDLSPLATLAPTPDGTGASYLLSRDTVSTEPASGRHDSGDWSSVASAVAKGAPPLTPFATAPTVAGSGPTAAQRRVRHYPYDAVPTRQTHAH